MTREFFGDGRDGDFTVPAAATYTLTRDMYWRNLRFVAAGGPTIVNPNGYVIRVSGTLFAPGLDASGNPQVYISRDGADAVFAAQGIGASVSGTIGGACGSGGGGFVFNGGAATAPDAWPSNYHPGAGGNGGGVPTLGTGGAGSSGSLLGVGDGSMDIVSSISMRLNSGGTLGGGGGGGGGGGDNGVSTDIGLGGGGGAGGGNIVLLARQIENASSVVVSSKGGRGGDGAIFGSGFAAGGGGGGGGGMIVIVLYRGPFPVTRVTGGAGGTPLGTGVAGTAGSAGAVIPFSFVL